MDTPIHAPAFPGVNLYVDDQESAFPGIRLKQSLLSSAHVQNSPRIHIPLAPSSPASTPVKAALPAAPSTSLPLPSPSALPTSRLSSSSSSSSASSDGETDETALPPVSPNAAYRSRLSIFGLFSPVAEEQNRSSGSRIESLSASEPPHSHHSTQHTATSMDTALRTIGDENQSSLENQPQDQNRTKTSKKTDSSSSSSSPSPSFTSSPSSSFYSLSSPSISATSVSISTHSIASLNQPVSPIPADVQVTFEAIARHVIPIVNELFSLLDIHHNEKKVRRLTSQLSALFKQLSELVEQQFQVKDFMNYLNNLNLEFSYLCLQSGRSHQRVQRFLELQNQLATSFERIFILEKNNPNHK